MQIRNRLIEIRNFGPCRAERRTEHDPALRLDDHAVSFETQVPVNTFDPRPPLGIVENRIMRLDGHQKIAFLLIKEGEIPQITPQGQPGLAGSPGNERVA